MAFSGEGAVLMIALPGEKVVKSRCNTISHRACGWQVRTGPTAHLAGWRAGLSQSCHKDRNQGSSTEQCESRCTPGFRDCLCIPEPQEPPPGRVRSGACRTLRDPHPGLAVCDDSC